MIEKLAKWLSDKPFFEEIYRQGGIASFTFAHKDIMETMADDLDKRAQELAETKLKDMLSPVDYRFVISRNLRTKQLMLGTVEMDAGQFGNLKSEAQFFKESNLWKLLCETPRELAHKAMFVEGDMKSFEKGRAMLYHLDSQQKILDTLLAYAPPKNIDNTK